MRESGAIGGQVEATIFNVELETSDGTLRGRLAAPPGPMRLMDIVPTVAMLGLEVVGLAARLFHAATGSVFSSSYLVRARKPAVRKRSRARICARGMK